MPVGTGWLRFGRGVSRRVLRRFAAPGRTDYVRVDVTGISVLRPVLTRFPDEVPFELERVPLMKYRDLISFEPIDSVKVLRDSEDLDSARRDVETLVVSPRLAEQLTDVILPNLDPGHRSRC